MKDRNYQNKIPPISTYILKYKDAKGKAGKPYAKILNNKISRYDFFKVT